MAKRAFEDLAKSDEGESDEPKAKRDEERVSSRKRTLIKVGLVGVLGVVAVLSLVSVLSQLWMYALGFLVLLGVGAGGYFYLKPKARALKERAAARLTARNPWPDT
jgi:hypothetical protein